MRHGIVHRENGAPDTIRTYDLPLRRGTLYPTELRGRGLKCLMGRDFGMDLGPARSRLNRPRPLP